jgi:hypothetical protein
MEVGSKAYIVRRKGKIKKMNRKTDHFKPINLRFGSPFRIR